VEAQIEARALMLSINNILSPASGRPVMLPSQDMVLGCYWLTKEKPGARGEGKTFSNCAEVRIAYDVNEIEEHAKIKVRINNAMIETTVGRVILSEILPKCIDFKHVNQLMSKKELMKLVDVCYREAGQRDTVLLLDRIKDIGFSYATKAGISICIDDMFIPNRKADLIEHARRDVIEIEKQYSDGLITNGERYNKVIDIWAHVTELIASEMMKELGSDKFNSIFMMADSGARGSAQQIRQLGGMRGLMAKPSGEIIETPITANFREGLTVLQ
jgi:DNA-directed RNA polymerase subunit beta'